jgi:hypothetical protein
MQYTFSEHSANIQWTFSEHSVNIQQTLSGHSVNIQRTYVEHAVNIERVGWLDPGPDGRTLLTLRGLVGLIQGLTDGRCLLCIKLMDHSVSIQ